MYYHVSLLHDTVAICQANNILFSSSWMEAREVNGNWDTVDLGGKGGGASS